MTATSPITNSNAPLLPINQPNRPPAPQRDNLDGVLDVHLAQAVTPHRDRLVDILRVIDGTPTGQTLLVHFRDRAGDNQPLVVNLLAAGTPLPDGAAAQDLWLNEADLAGHAEQIGVPPEVQYAPSVFQNMVRARNAWVAQQCIDYAKQHYTDQATQAPDDLQARFEQELAGHRNTVSRPLDRAQTLQAVQAQTVAKALDALQVNHPLRAVPTDPKPGGTAPYVHLPASDQNSAQTQQIRAASQTTPISDHQTLKRRESAPSSLASADAGAKPSETAAPGVIVPLVPTASAGPNGGPNATSNHAPNLDSNHVPGANNSGHETTATSNPKTPRRRLTQWIDKRFQAFTDTLARLRRGRDQSGRHEVVQQASVSRSSSISGSSSKSTATTQHPPV